MRTRRHGIDVSSRAPAMSSIVWRRRMTRSPAVLSTMTSAGSGADCSSTPSPSRRRRRRGPRTGRRPPVAGSAGPCRACRCSRRAGRRCRRASPGRSRVVDRLDAMERVVEHRPDQLGHPGVEDDEQLAAWLLLDVDDPRQERARRPDDAAARLEDDRQARVADGRQQRPRRIPARVGATGCRRTRCRGRRRDRDARSRTPSSRSSRASVDERRRGAAQRLEVRDLRADVLCRPTISRPGAVAHAPAELARRRRSRCRTCWS